MQEFDFLKEKKKNMEFITPQKLRDFIKDKVGDAKDKIIFDCAVGSGQLLYGIEAKKKLGFDINEKSVECAIQNGIEAKKQDYILFDDDDFNYDYVISNYPFSLKATEEQQKYLCSKYMIKKYTGVLDKEFILKSFRKAEKGFYLCFPGISYRGAELPFRQHLIDNNYVEQIILLENTNFRDTTINILYLQLNKHKTNDKILIQHIDDYKVIFEKEITNQDIKNNEYDISVDKFKPEEKFDPLGGKDLRTIQNEYYESALRVFRQQLQLINLIREIDPEAYKDITIDKIKNDFMEIVNKEFKNEN